MVNDLLVKGLSFVVGACGVLAQAGDLNDPKVWIAAVGTGAGAVLALMRAPNAGALRPPFGGGQQRG